MWNGMCIECNELYFAIDNCNFDTVKLSEINQLLEL